MYKITGKGRPLHVVCGRLEQDEMPLITTDKPDQPNQPDKRKQPNSPDIPRKHKVKFFNNVPRVHIEIDFMTGDKTLIEVKYMSDMTGKQKTLFEKIKAKEKMVIRGVRDIQSLR